MLWLVLAAGGFLAVRALSTSSTVRRPGRNVSGLTRVSNSAVTRDMTRTRYTAAGQAKAAAQTSWSSTVTSKCLAALRAAQTVYAPPSYTPLYFIPFAYEPPHTLAVAGRDNFEYLRTEAQKKDPTASKAWFSALQFRDTHIDLDDFVGDMFTGGVEGFQSGGPAGAAVGVESGAASNTDGGDEVLKDFL